MNRTGFVGLALCLSIATALGQDIPKVDNSGKGAVLCAEMILLDTIAITKACKWDRVATDDVIDAAVKDIDAFVIANSRSPVTQTELDQQEAAYMSRSASLVVAQPEQCKVDPEDNTSGFTVSWQLRQMTPLATKAWIKDLLSIPREPLLNPCL